MDLAMVRSLLPAHDILWFDRVESTMPLAARLAAEGARHQTVVGADEQTAGQGRYGRHWHSEAASGLYFSILLKLGLPAETAPVITLALGLAVAEAIEERCGVACDLRWPNDVLIQGRKCAGILVQLHGDAVVAGIGVNVNQREFPAELSSLATSIRLATGREQERESLLVALLCAIGRLCDTLASEGKEPVLRMFAESSSFVRGRRVKVDQGGSSVEGVTEGLDGSGFLLLRRPDGRRETILAGGVRPAG